MLGYNKLVKEINRLKKEKNAVLLAHNYQLPEIQDIADYVGDSFGLSKSASKTDAEVIVFCGVHFMAETASIISPNKKVLIPVLDAGCSLAESISADQLRKWKKANPGALVVAYINTSAEIKSLSDYCCTSSNAVKIVEAIPKDKKILFLPDKYLGTYIKVVTKRNNMDIWSGACHVHEKIGDVSFNDAKKLYPEAEYLVHPECGCSSSCLLKTTLYNDCNNIHIYSTEGMINHIEKSNNSEFVIATEKGILHKMKKIAPEKKFYPISEDAVCEYMKLITLPKLYTSLLENKIEVKVPEEVAKKARVPIERMLQVA